MHKFLLITLILVLNALSVLGQGYSFSEYYSPEAYGSEMAPGHPQNWEIAEDQFGILHFGNGNGLMSFNGVSWIDNHIGESGRGLAFYHSSDSVLYIAGSTNFGRVRTDSLNNIQYESISDLFYGEDERHPIVWSIHEAEGYIYFSHLNGIGQFDPRSNTYVNYPLNDAPLSIGSLQIGSVIYKDGATGLWAFQDSTYTFVPGSETFRSQDLQFSLVLSDGKWLLGSNATLNGQQKSSFWTFDGKNIQSFEGPASTYLSDKFIFDAIRIDDNTLAVATIFSGVVLMNEQGEIVRILNERTGLHTNEVYDLYLDKEDNLWLGMNEGIQKLSLDTHIIDYSDWAGIEGTITDIAITKDEMYVYAFPNLYRKKVLQPENLAVFERVKSTSDLVYLYSWNGEVYMYGARGIEKLRGSLEPEWIYQGTIKEVIETPSTSNQLSFIGADVIISINEKGEVTTSPLNFEESIGYAALYGEDIFVTLGNKNNAQRIGRIDTDAIDPGVEIVPVEYDTSSVLNITRLGFMNGKLFLSGEGIDANNGLYEYDPDRDRFRKSNFMDSDPDFRNKQVYNFLQCSDEEIWITANKKTFQLKIQNGEWVSRKAPFKPLSNSTSYSMACDSNGVWLGRVDQTLFLSNEEWEYDKEFQTNLTGVYIERDSLIYGGYGEVDQDHRITYSNNELRFRYASASFISPDKNEYQVKLEGFDETWSDWNTENQKDYTNIPEGTYTFRVKSRNVFEAEGSEAGFSFEILPPWYRTWWAYLLYFLSITGTLYLVYRVRVNQLLRVQRIRNNIASDLHDEVSATLSSISYFAQAIKNEDMKGDKTRFVNLISNSAGDAKEKITDIVWAINPEHDNWEAFLSKCRRYASDLLESKDMQYSLKIDENIPGKLDMQLRQHLWLIFKEMVTNAARHSNASQLDVIFSYQDGRLKLIVQDNGNGMDVDKVRKGNGLVNIHNRAEMIGAQISLKTSEGFGTRWSLNISL